MVIEVFKTNVVDASEAGTLVDRIHASFQSCKANFDLEDCDHILRVVSDDIIHVRALIEFLHDCGYKIEVLSDDIPQLIQL